MTSHRMAKRSKYIKGGHNKAPTYLVLCNNINNLSLFISHSTNKLCTKASLWTLLRAVHKTQFRSCPDWCVYTPAMRMSMFALDIEWPTAIQLIDCALCIYLSIHSFIYSFFIPFLFRIFLVFYTVYLYGFAFDTSLLSWLCVRLYWRWRLCATLLSQ